MNFAVIPWIEDLMQDILFDEGDRLKDPDHRYSPYLDMKKAFEKNKDQCHTVDYYDHLQDVDFFLFFELNLKWAEKIVRAGMEDKMVYCNAEPPAVYSRNCPGGYRKLAKLFPYIMTWNDDWVDEKLIFKRNIPYYFEDNRGIYQRENKKLLTLISGNKCSQDVNELYSEREKVITFFEERYKEDFAFYGTGWSRAVHPSYGGYSEKKAETYSGYKFAVCFENSKNLKGYITEKILDCFASGIVPVYAGAPNISEYVPEECFIDYWKFENLQELADFLFDMDEEKYVKYLQAADRFLKSDAFKQFSGEKYAEYIYQAIAHKKAFAVSVGDKWLLIIRNRYNSLKHGIKSAIKSFIRVR